MFQTGEINTGSFEGGGALKILRFAPDSRPITRTLLEVPQGVVRDPDVRFDGRRILVSRRWNREDDYHIHELGADGTGLVQLTFGSGISDIDPIYPDYSTAYPDHLFGRSPIDMAQLRRLGELVGLDLTDRRFAAAVSFTRPELSPCLARFADKADLRYREALAIIEAGKRALAVRPSTELAGFQLVSRADVEREAKYRARRASQAAAREAIIKGQRQYEK